MFVCFCHVWHGFCTLFVLIMLACSFLCVFDHVGMVSLHVDVLLVVLALCFHVCVFSIILAWFLACLCVFERDLLFENARARGEGCFS